jgi:hypothetical protein
VKNGQLKRKVSRLSWPSVVLAGGVLLSLTANLAQAQPTVWGQVMAGTPCAAFLVAVSMLERRAARRGPVSVPVAAAGPHVIPRQDDQAGSSSPAAGPSSPPGDGQDDEDGTLLAAARRAAAGHQAATGQPITRDALRARLGVSNQAASDLLRQIRASEGRYPPGHAHAA